jgi:phosphoadenosine phosphosulfate reductase
MKQRGQRSANPILDWTSFEVWLYIYFNNLVINNAYKKGSQRVGCLCCPMGGSKADYIQYSNYKKEIDAWT